jgi:hypothetical protein
LLAFALALSASLPAFAQAGPAGRRAAELEYRRDATAVVLRYVEDYGELAPQTVEKRSLTVYGDGRVVRETPPYMKGAGRAELVLSEAEVDGLLRSMVRRGVVDFDEARARADREAVARARTTLHASSDASTTQIEIVLERYRAVGEIPPARAVAKTVRWRGLRADARQYPEVGELRDLDAARRELETLRKRPGYRRLP